MEGLQLMQIMGTAILVLVVFSFVKSHFDRRSLPPGPPAWPIIGNMHLLGNLPHHSLQGLSKIYGPLMYLKVGSIPLVVVSSPTVAKEILKVQDHVFSNRPKTVSGWIMFYGRRDILWSDVGPYWRHLRKICRLELFSNARLASYKTIRREEITSTLKEILQESKGTQAVRLDKHVEAMTQNNITRMMWSKKFFGAAAEGSSRDEKMQSRAEKMQSVIRVATEVSGSFLPGECIPFLRWLDIGGLEAKISTSFEKLDAFMNGLLEEHRNKNVSVGDPNDLPDTMDLLLSLTGPEKLTDDDIKAFSIDMILGGTDTSANQLLWTMAELMKNPHIMKRAQEELSSVVGPNRQVEESDLPNLTYLQAIVKESLRLHPVAPILPPRITGQATQVAGYRIPKGTGVLVSIYAIQRDPCNWDRALEFDPGRFLNTGVDVKGTDYKIIPFGSGRRVCPGLNLGLLMVHLPLAQFLHDCNWSLPAGVAPKDVDLSEKHGLTVPMLNPLKVIVSPRFRNAATK